MSMGLMMIDPVKHIQLNRYYLSQFVTETATENLNAEHTVHHVLYHHLLTTSCALHCVYNLTYQLPLLCVSVSTDTIFGKPQPKV